MIGYWFALSSGFALWGYAAFVLLRNRPSCARVLHALLFGLIGCIQLFDGLALFDSDHFFFHRRQGLFVESLLPLLLAVTTQLFFPTGKLLRPSRVQQLLLLGAPLFLVAFLFFPSTAFFFNPDVATEQVLFLGGVGYWFYLALVGYEVASLVQLEQALTGLSREDLWKGKFQIVGAGAIIAVFLVYHSQSLLYRTLDLRLLSVRSVVIFVGLALMLYAQIWRGDVRKLTLSRQAAFRSVVLLLAGGYFLVLALVGQGMRYLGSVPQKPLMIGIGFALGLLLLTVMLSDQLQRRLKVFLHKHFYRNKYEYRQQWLDFTERLADVENERNLQERVLEFTCATFSLHGGAIYLHDPEQSCCLLASRYRIGPLPVSLADDSPLVSFVAASDWVYDAANDDPAVAAAHTEIFGGGPARFVVPFHFGRRLEGLLVLGELVEANEELTYEDYDLMKMIARQAGTTLLSLRLTGQLSTARELAAIGKVSTFVVHDLKNLVSGLALVSENAQEYLDDPEFQRDMLRTLEKTVTKMQKLIEKLKNLKDRPELRLVSCDLAQVAQEVASGLQRPDLACELQPVVAEADPAELQRVLLNLVLNAYDAGGGRGPVRLATGLLGRPFIQVSDQGCGMSEEFMRTRLFRPFETTRKNGLGIGLYQCRALVEGMGGRIEVMSEEGRGTTFTVWLPTTTDEVAEIG